MVGRSGCLGLLIIAAAIYYSGAGSWMGRQLNAINDNCYATLAGIGPDIANPVCQGVAAGFNVTNQALANLGDKIAVMKQRMLGDTSLDTLESYTIELTSNLTNLASSSSDLTNMISLGPNNTMSFASKQPFQNAIDSFAIGQNFFKDPANALKGIPWLQRGAQQPQGYGLMSQLALGNVYANGVSGVAANPKLASAYLAQANRSISLLSASNTPQSQQILKSLPMDPQQMQREIARITRDLSSGMK